MTCRLPRLLTKEQICAYLGGICAATYDQWHAKGIVPGSVRGTNRYDVRAHDIALDRWSGINDQVGGLSPLEQWREDQRKTVRG